MADTPLEFNADERAAKRREGKITIGGQQFHRAPKTPERMERYFDALPDTAPSRDELRGDLALSKEFSKKENEISYQQLGILLLDDKGQEADVGFLREKLEVDDAGALLDLLMPPQQELERQGNSDAADAPTD